MWALRGGVRCTEAIACWKGLVKLSNAETGAFARGSKFLDVGTNKQRLRSLKQFAIHENRVRVRHAPDDVALTCQKIGAAVVHLHAAIG